MAVIAKNWTELKKPNRLEQRPSGDGKQASKQFAHRLRSFWRAYDFALLRDDDCAFCGKLNRRIGKGQRQTADDFAQGED